jgi:hypothetical protein
MPHTRLHSYLRTSLRYAERMSFESAFLATPKTLYQSSSCPRSASTGRLMSISRLAKATQWSKRKIARGPRLRLPLRRTYHACAPGHYCTSVTHIVRACGRVCVARVREVLMNTHLMQCRSALPWRCCATSVDEIKEGLFLFRFIPTPHYFFDQAQLSSSRRALSVHVQKDNILVH